MKKSFKKLAAVIGVSAALGLGVAGQARADALAEAWIGVTGFTLTNGTTALSLTDFTQLSFQDTLANTATLNGAGTFQFAFSNDFAPATDALQACLGTCPGQNVFTNAGIPLTTTFARSDSLLTGVPISGTPIPGPVGTSADTIGQVSLKGTATGAAASTIQLTSTFTFVLAHDVGQLGITFNAAEFLRTWTEPLTKSPTQAGSTVSWSLTLKDGDTTLLAWTPNGVIGDGTETGLNVTAEACNLNRNSAATFNDPQALFQCSGAFAATSSVLLQGGHSYSFTIGQSVNTNARSVPEPGSLALLGLGLAGLGFSVFRRRKVS